MAVAALDHPSHAAMVPQGYGAGIGTVGDYYEQGNWYRGGAQQMLFTSWLYWVQNGRIRPMFPKDATQEELEAKHVLFMTDDRDGYLDKLYAWL